MIIGIDFDGTCVTHEFPRIGKDIGAVPILKKLIRNRHNLILFTMRSDKGEDKNLASAVNWFRERGIPLWGINENPEQHRWTASPKPYCHVYIDDVALGCPLFYDAAISKRPYVDWMKVKELLSHKGLI
jgi:hypothetical protein